MINEERDALFEQLTAEGPLPYPQVRDFVNRNADWAHLPVDLARMLISAAFYLEKRLEQDPDTDRVGLYYSVIIAFYKVGVERGTAAGEGERE